MPRPMDAGFLAAVQLDVIRPVTLIEFDFPSGFVFVHTRLGTLPFDGQDYQGLGSLLEVSPLRGAEGLEAFGLTFRLSGMTPNLTAIVMGETYRGRRVRLWQGLLDESGALAGTCGPWRYRTDSSEFDFAPECTWTLSVESELMRLRRPLGIYWTDAEQKRRHPGDRMFELAPQAADRVVVWPAVPGAGASTLNRSSGGGSGVGNDHRGGAIGDDFHGDVTYSVGDPYDSGRGQ